MIHWLDMGVGHWPGGSLMPRGPRVLTARHENTSIAHNFNTSKTFCSMISLVFIFLEVLNASIYSYFFPFFRKLGGLFFYLNYKPEKMNDRFRTDVL